MPKKPPRNSFYFFMHDFREEQKKKGITYANMAEVAEAAGPAWTSATPQVRSKFEAIAKAEKAKTSVPERKFTSNGISFAEIEAAEQEKRDAERAELKDIKDFVNQHAVTNSLQNEDIYLVDVNCYCKAGISYLVGEFTILQFNVVDGIKEAYHELIHPGGIPIGYAYDVKMGGQELGLEMPDENERPSDYMQILATTVDFLQRGRCEGGGGRGPRGRGGRLPALYTLPDKVQPVLDFIHQMCTRAVEDETIFRVYRLDTLFFHMMASAAKRPEDGLPRESLALAQLKKDIFKYSPGLGCAMHEEGEKSVECTLARTKRWAYTVLDSLVVLYDLTAKPVQHLPPSADITTTLALKEERRGGGVAARVAGAGGGTSECSFSSEYSLPAQLGRSNISDTRTEKKRAYVPLRKPNTDYSQAVRAPPLVDSEFPRLAGRGRGRGYDTKN